MKGYVYLLAEMGDNLRYKIGVTKNDVDKRVKQLKTGNSDDIMLIHKYKTKNYRKLEALLHRKFRKDRKHLEWFEMTDEQVMTFMDEAKKADELIDFLKENNHFYD